MFAIYINDLIEKLHNAKHGVKLARSILSVLAFADDVLCFSRTSKAGTEEQMRIIMNWCAKWKMEISQSKTYIATMSRTITEWEVEGNSEQLSFDESRMFTYLGVDFRVKGRDFLGDHYEKMLKKADKYVFAILNTTRDLLDRSLVARSLWETCALPAIMYGTEACVLSKRCLKELEQKQKIIASFVTGLPRAGGNTALLLESGLIPIESRYHVRLHRFFNHLLESSSELVQEALIEHKHSDWSSPYRELIIRVIRQYNVSGMTKEAAKSVILETTWNTLLKEVYELKSLKFLSIRNSMFELPGHVNDSEHSTTLCQFRTGNTGIGNRIPLQGTTTQLKVCPICYEEGRVSTSLNERHLLFSCSSLRDIQARYGFRQYAQTMGQGRKELLWEYLGGDKCSNSELQTRGRRLLGFLNEYMTMVFQTDGVKNILRGKLRVLEICL